MKDNNQNQPDGNNNNNFKDALKNIQELFVKKHPNVNSLKD